MTATQLHNLKIGLGAVVIVLGLFSLVLVVEILRGHLRPWFAAREERAIRTWAGRGGLKVVALASCERGEGPSEWYDPEEYRTPWRLEVADADGSVRGAYVLAIPGRLYLRWDGRSDDEKVRL